MDVILQYTSKDQYQKFSEQMSQLTYTNNQSLYDAVHSMKQTLQKQLIVDISLTCEMIKRNKIEVTWIEQERQDGDVLTKAVASSIELLNF